uniref:Polyprenal reductase n=1 Tax=Lates calcarifer TaxID=8187 RepID=A0A4W6CE52_LATCA
MSWSSVSLSLIDILWCFLASCFLVAFCAHKILRKYDTCRLYMLFQDLIRYGKTKQNLKRDDWLRVFDVPKRWFWHFYAISVCWNGLLLALYLNFIFQHQSLLPVVPQLSTMLVQLLLWVHSVRRLLECLFVSVFSDGSMHLVQYVFGLGYYIVLGLTVLCSDHVGKVETLTHREPKGGWFELVSCPHYFAELLIYISLTMVFRGLSLTWWLIVLYVFFNQALAAQLCHDLYLNKYKSYPKHRKAFIPFVL